MASWTRWRAVSVLRRRAARAAAVRGSGTLAVVMRCPVRDRRRLLCTYRCTRPAPCCRVGEIGGAEGGGPHAMEVVLRFTQVQGERVVKEAEAGNPCAAPSAEYWTALPAVLLPGIAALRHPTDRNRHTTDTNHRHPVRPCPRTDWRSAGRPSTDVVELPGALRDEPRIWSPCRPGPLGVPPPDRGHPSRSWRRSATPAARPPTPLRKQKPGSAKRRGCRLEQRPGAAPVLARGLRPAARERRLWRPPEH